MEGRSGASILLQKVDLAERVERKVDVAARLGRRHVLLRYRLDLENDHGRLSHLHADVQRSSRMPTLFVYTSEGRVKLNV